MANNSQSKKEEFKIETQTVKETLDGFRDKYADQISNVQKQIAEMLEEETNYQQNEIKKGYDRMT